MKAEFYYHTPDNPLSQYVQYIVIVKGTFLMSKTKLLPKVTNMLVFNLSRRDNYSVKAATEESTEITFKSWIAGIQHNYLLLQSGMEADLVLVAFRPGGCYALFGIPASEFTNQYIETGLIKSKIAEEILEKLYKSDCNAEKVRIIKEILLRNLFFDDYPIHVQMNRLLYDGFCNGELPISELMKKAGYAPRHVIAQFKEYAGTSPKKYYRLNRFRRLVEALNNEKQPVWKDIGCQYGYYDQSHLIREFKEFSGLTPGQYLFKEKFNESFCSID